MQQGFLRPGDELRLDAVRFMLVAPGMEMPAPPTPAAPQPLTRGQKMQIGASVLLIAAALVVIVLLLAKS